MASGLRFHLQEENNHEENRTKTLGGEIDGVTKLSDDPGTRYRDGPALEREYFQGAIKAAGQCFGLGFCALIRAWHSGYLGGLKVWYMRSVTRVIAMITVTSLLGGVVSSGFAAGAGKGGANQRGGKAGEHRSGKASENSNAQWSADPDRGWVRANERRSRDNDPAERGKQNNGKQKGKGKAKKS